MPGYAGHCLYTAINIRILIIACCVHLLSNRIVHHEMTNYLDFEQITSTKTSVPTHFQACRHQQYIGTFLIFTATC